MYLCHIMGLTTDVLLSQCTLRHGYITSPKLSLPLFASRESFNSKVGHIWFSKVYISTKLYKDKLFKSVNKIGANWK